MDQVFDTRIPRKALGPLLQLGKEIGFDPTSSEEAEAFFATLVDRFVEKDDEIEVWLRGQLANSFKCTGQIPVWIQNPNWPCTSDGPMLFIGQINVPVGLFHDEAAFYTFFEAKTGLVRTILQVA